MQVLCADWWKDDSVVSGGADSKLYITSGIEIRERWDGFLSYDLFYLLDTFIKVWYSSSTCKLFLLLALTYIHALKSELTPDVPHVFLQNTVAVLLHNYVILAKHIDVEHKVCYFFDRGFIADDFCSAREIWKGTNRSLMLVPRVIIPISFWIINNVVFINWFLLGLQWELLNSIGHSAKYLWRFL